MLRTLAIWAVLTIMDLLMSLWPRQELSDPGRKPKSLYQPRVECGPHCPSRPVVSGEKRENSEAPPKMHQQQKHPGQRAGQMAAGRGGASGMKAGAREAGPGPCSPPALKDRGLRSAETTSCSPSPAQEAPEAPSTCSTASKHLLSKPSMIFTPCVKHSPVLASESERSQGPVAACPHSTWHRGGPKPLPGAKELQESRFCLFSLFTVLSLSDQNRAWRIVGA